MLGIFLIVYGIFNNNAVSVSPLRDKEPAHEITVINDWFPKTKEDINLDKLEVSAKAAILVNYDTGEVLYGKNISDRLPAASTIKIMTALVAMEETKPADVFTVSKKAAEIGEDTMGLSEGEKVKFSDLLYGLMLPSGNDAAVVIAEGVSGSEDSFVALMNRKGLELGLGDSKFINASGLDVDGETQFSSAWDLATIARYTWENYPQIRKVAATDHIFIEGNQNHKGFDLYNDTNLLTTYPGVRGIKPGFTWEAGYCLVTYAENNGVKLIGVLLASENRRVEMTRLLDFGFARYGITVEHPDLDFL